MNTPVVITKANGRRHFSIEHDEGVLAFYEKLGFVPNIELSSKMLSKRKLRKTISMRADLYA